MWIGMARVGSGRNECCTGVVLCGRSECGDAGLEPGCGAGGGETDGARKVTWRCKGVEGLHGTKTASKLGKVG